MIVLLAAAVMFLFLVLGAVAFVVCVAVPSCRKYALSTALWFAAWGPCVIGGLVLGGVGLIAGSFVHLQAVEVPQRLLPALGWGYVAASVCTTVILASGLAWIHQKLIHRLTFALFRLYATAVSAGIGSVFGWCIVWWLLFKPMAPYGLWLWPFVLLLSILVFGAEAFKKAHVLRGALPTRFTWITPEEFAGTTRR